MWRASGLEARHEEPSFGPSAVDQLLGCKARPRAQISEVTLRGARPDAQSHGRVRDGSADGDEGSEDVNLTGSAPSRWCAPQIAAFSCQSPSGGDRKSTRLNSSHSQI